MSVFRVVLVGAVIAVFAVVAVLLVPEDEPDPAAPVPDLNLEVKLDKKLYGRAERVNATVTVRNRGDVASEPLSVDCAGEPVATPMILGKGSERVLLDGGLDVGVLKPLESRSGVLHGVVSQEAYDMGMITAVCTMTVDGVYHEAQFNVPVTGASNTVTGRFTVCTKDGSNPGATGMRLTLDRLPMSAPAPEPGPWSAVTDASGAFTFPVVPAGRYQLTYEPPAGYIPTTIPGEGNTVQVLVAADGLRWQASTLTVTTADPITACDDPVG
jgi:hypothetical protein